MQGAAEPEELRRAPETVAGAGLVEVLQISTRGEMADVLSKNEGPYWIRGSGVGDRFRCPRPAPARPLTFSGSQVLEISAADQVAVFEAGISLDNAQAALAKEGQALPILSMPSLTNTLSLGGSLSLNLPHPLEGRCGSWRDWVLGLTAVLPSGEILKCGSRAVKNVAGYDMHKLFVGARGTIGVLVEVVLRTYPLAMFHEVAQNVTAIVADGLTETIYIQRTLRSDFPAAKEAANKLLLADEMTSTLWSTSPDGEILRFPHDWILRTGACPEITSPLKGLMSTVKRVFDPHNKLNSGEFAFI